MRNKILTLLVLLLTAATGAWADELATEYSTSPSSPLSNVTVTADMDITIDDVVTVTINNGLTIATGKTLTVRGGGTLIVNGAEGSTGNAGGTAISGDIIVKGATVQATGGQGGIGFTATRTGGTGGQGGTAISGTIIIYSGTITATGGKGGTGGAVDGHFGVAGDGGNGGYAIDGPLTVYGGNVTAQGGSGGQIGSGAQPGSEGAAANAFSSDVTFEATEYTMKSGNTDITTATGYHAVNISAADTTDPNDILVTISTNKKEATFAMPAYDATATYELVRDMAYEVTATLSSSRIRITKDASDKFVTAVDDALALTVSDVISGSAVAMSAYDATTNVDGDYTATLQKQGDTENDWSDVSELSVGTFRYLVTGKNNYDGTINTATFELFQGYEVTVPAGEYITYYKDENLRLDEADKASIELYTITGVSGTTATLSSAVDAMKANKPMLVYNKGDVDKTILLIPCDEPDLQLTFAPEFKGTLTASTIAASTDNVSNYALNGKQFVIVRSNLEIGANKCWLSVEATNGARAINLVFDDATRIDGMIRANDLNGDYYDLNGRKLQGIPTRKGVYIQNGKKVVVK